MAYPNQRLIDALRETAGRLREGAYYAWGHHGACNCGNLLQVITCLSKEEILRVAHQAPGEWTELAADYCETTRAPLSLIISSLHSVGLTNSDIHNLEFLEDREVLNHLPGGFRWLKKNCREDTILYFETFAAILDNRLQQKKKQHHPIQIRKLSAVSKEKMPACS